MSRDVKKFKPVMTVKDEMDSKLLGDLRFLLLELRTISPFFGILASEMFIAGPSKSVPTIGVSPRGVVVYNEDFMRGLSPGERVAVFVHEALHVSLDYWARFKGTNWKIANWAHDFVINDIIKKGMSDLKIVRRQGKDVFELGVKLPAGGAWSADYENMSGEEVYNILYDGVAKRAKEIKDQYLATMADPAAKAAMEREQKINKELRISLQKGGKLLSEKEDEASSKTKVADDEIAAANDSFMDALRDKESMSLNFREDEYEDTKPDIPQQSDQSNEKGDDQPSDPANAEPSNDGEPGDQQNNGEPGQEGKGDQSEQSNDAGEQSNDPQSSGQPDSDGQPSGDSPTSQTSSDQPEGGEPNPYQQAKQEMQDAMGEAFNDYMGKEKDRISNDVDQTPDGTTREQHLDELSKELDEIGDKYVDDVTKAREQGFEEPQQDSPQDGQPQPGDEPGEKGDGQPEPGKEGEGAEGMEGEGEPGDGQPQPGQDGQPGEGEPGQPGEGGDQPGEGQPGEGGKPGKAGAGQPGSGGQPGGQSQGQGQGDPVSEQTARQDVQDAIESMKNQVSNSLGGKPQGKPGMDQRMASGQDAMDSEGFDQAMRELADKLGSGMDGDVDMDCSDIENNPYASEANEETEERRRQMLTRAVVEDMQNGGQGVGTLPGWFKSEIDKILYPPMSFSQELEKFIGPYGATTQRSFSVRNKRNTFLPNHMIRPGMKKNSAKIYILLDVSGSMMNGKDAENLAHAMGLVDQLASALRMEVNVIQCDTGVTRVLTTQEALEEVAKKKFEVHGQGGSNLIPAFEHIWHEMVVFGGNRGNPIVCFTDGAITVPDSVPDGLRQQCLWVTNPGQSAPTSKWGEHRILENMG